MTTYIWHPPRYRSGERVAFLWGTGGTKRIGTIGNVETKYTDGVAWHGYSIRVDGHKTWRHVGENDVLFLTHPRVEDRP